MSDDLVRQIKERRLHHMYPHHLDELLDEAATALTEARAEIERLRNLLGDPEGTIAHADAITARAEKAESALAKLAPLRDMLIFCEELGGMRSDDTFADYLRRLIDGLITSQSALAEAGWHTFADQPASGRKFIALYNDGSGASMFFAFDGGVIDSDGDELYDWFSSDHSYDRWAYLPDNLEFWCEVRADDPVTFTTARAFVQQHEGKM